MARPVVVALVGPTGTGKTELAARVARETGAEIIGVDSMQVYRGLDIGTAKPPAALRREIPHHLIDVVEPDDPMSAGRYAELARAAAREITARGCPVLMCGGTGLYARAFAGGLLPEAGSDPELRAELSQRETNDLYRELCSSDPDAAGDIKPNDRVRILRALEIQQLSGESVSSRRAAHGFGDRPFDVRWLGVGMDRERLEQRIRARVDAMFAAGLVDEVKGLYSAGYGPELRSLQAIGYREVGWLLAGRVSEGEAREAIAVATRRYAKRQFTWFRSEAGLVWLDAEQPEQVVRQAAALLAGAAASAG